MRIFFMAVEVTVRHCWYSSLQLFTSRSIATTGKKIITCDCNVIWCNNDRFTFAAVSYETTALFEAADIALKSSFVRWLSVSCTGAFLQQAQWPRVTIQWGHCIRGPTILLSCRVASRFWSPMCQRCCGLGRALSMYSNAAFDGYFKNFSILHCCFACCNLGIWCINSMLAFC